MRLHAALALILLLSAPGASGLTLSGEIVKIKDGDSIIVRERTSRTFEVRLSGIDAPEYDQEFGRLSHEKLVDLLEKKYVVVEVHDVDRWGRLVGKVMQADQDAALVLLESGLAWVFDRYVETLPDLDRKAYEAAERKAREQKRGLWSESSPVPPWEFRQNGGSARALSSATDRPPPSETVLIGNRRSRIYHRSDCPSYSRVSRKNRVYFLTAEEAEGAGYRLARNCP